MNGCCTFNNELAFQSDPTQTGSLHPKNGKYYVVVLMTDNPDIANINIEKKLIREALKEYEAEIKYDIRVYDREEFLQFPHTTKEIDVTIEFVTDDEYFTPSILAYAGFPNGAFRGIMRFNNAHVWIDGYGKTGAELRKIGIVLPGMVDTQKYKTWNVRQTAKHEFGHILGLEHNTVDKTSVMYAYYGEDRIMLSESDKEILRFKYGEPDLKKKIRKAFAYIRNVMTRPI